MCQKGISTPNNLQSFQRAKRTNHSSTEPSTPSHSQTLSNLPHNPLHNLHNPRPHPARLQTPAHDPKAHQRSPAQHKHHAERSPELPDRVLFPLQRHAEVRHDQTHGQEEDGEFGEQEGDAGEVLDVEGLFVGEEGEVLWRGCVSGRERYFGDFFVEDLLARLESFSASGTLRSRSERTDRSGL